MKPRNKLFEIESPAFTHCITFRMEQFVSDFCAIKKYTKGAPESVNKVCSFTGFMKSDGYGHSGNTPQNFGKIDLSCLQTNRY